MRKLTTLALSVTMLSAGAVNALDLDPKFYVGGELQAGKPTVTKKFVDKNNTFERADGKAITKKGVVGVAPIVGVRMNEYFGLEAGGSFMNTQKQTVETAVGAGKLKEEFNLKSNNVHVDALGYIPINCDFDAIVSAGVGKLTTKISEKDTFTPNGGGAVRNLGSFNGKSSKVGARFGVGGQYKINENLNARLMLRNQQGNKIVRSLNTVNAGLFYNF